MDILKNIYKELIKRRIIVIIGAIILLIIGFFFFRGDKKPEYNLAIAERGSIREEVSVTGKIEAIENIDLSFRATGNVSQVLIETGNKVKKGQVLASLENNDLWAQLRQAQANLEAEEAKLSELEKGTRLETINIKETELSKVQQDLDNYYEDILDVLNDSYAKAEEAIKIKIKDIFLGAEAANSYILNFDTCVSNEISSNVGYSRLISERKLKEWKNQLSIININSSKEELNLAMKNAKEYAVSFKDFFGELNNILLADCSYSNPNLDVYRIDTNTGRNLIITAITNINNLEQSIASQGLLVKKTQNELNLLLSGATKEEIIIQEAKVKSAQANVSNYYALIEKTIIRAPIDGFIAKKEIKESEVVLANISVISLMTEKGLQIKTYIPEVDVSKVKVGDRVLITLDAFPRKEFFGEIVHIDSAETIVDGVVYYKVKSTIDTKDTNIKSGMTADIIIITDSKKDTLIIPRRAVTEKDEKNIVRVPLDGDFQEIEVETGLVGSDGNIEIISGLKEGDQVITFIKK
jgi:RND family efflux transporter MFP subunit